jgi:hypothetical protein
VELTAMDIGHLVDERDIDCYRHEVDYPPADIAVDRLAFVVKDSYNNINL